MQTEATQCFCSITMSHCTGTYPSTTVDKYIIIKGVIGRKNGEGQPATHAHLRHHVFHVSLGFEEGQAMMTVMVDGGACCCETFAVRT